MYYTSCLTALHYLYLYLSLLRAERDPTNSPEKPILVGVTNKEICLLMTICLIGLIAFHR